jgi:hypothetical protein
MKTCTYLLAATLAITLTQSAYAATLISHAFDGAGVLGGTALDVNNVSASTWNSHVSITADGTVDFLSTTSGVEGSAYIDLGASTITMGAADDIYEFEIVIDQQSPDLTIHTFGFWSTDPGTNKSHDSQGSPWVVWRTNGNMESSTGRGYSQDNYDGNVSAAGGYETFTYVLDLTNAALSNNTVSLYHGAAQLGSTVTFSGDEGFQYVGFGASTFQPNRQALASVQSMKLTQIPEPGTYALLAGLLCLSYAAMRRRRAS